MIEESVTSFFNTKGVNLNGRNIIKRRHIEKQAIEEIGFGFEKS